MSFVETKLDEPLRRLAESARRLAAHPQISELGCCLVEEFRLNLEADRVAVFLWDGKQFVPASWLAPGEAPYWGRAVEDSLFTSVVAERKPLVVGDGGESAPGSGFTALFPLAAAAEAISGVVLVQRRDPRPFTGLELELGSILASLCAQALGALHEREERMRLTAAIEQSAETIVITDVQGNIQYCNPAFERITGYTREEAIGQNPRVLKSGKHDAAFYEELWHTILAGKVWTGRFTNRRKDGSLFDEEATISPIVAPSNSIRGFVAVKRDVTERLELEARFRQAQKMEAVGKLAGGVAHDFNNLLTVINGYSELLLDTIEKADPLHESVVEIRNAGERAAGLTQQLLAFSRRQVIHPVNLDLNTVIRELEKMLRRLIAEDIELVTQLEPSLGVVKCDPGQIQQVLMNLAVNARDAMPDGGRLIIATTNVRVNVSAVEPRWLAPGDYVLMTVSDTGFGMDQEVQAHLFEPFFTTKELGRGTGLGLSTVYGIVKQSGGCIAVHSEVDKGTTFTIYFPRTDEAAVTAPWPAPAARSHGTETVLVAEDQEEVRRLAVSVLKRCGYKVLAAANGGEALLICERHTRPIHLLVSDVVMPGMTGRILAERLKSLRPEMKVLFMSGYTDEIVLGRGVLDSELGLLQKPFTPQTLAAKVREVLGPSSHPPCWPL